jgi:hypothetical protein
LFSALCLEGRDDVALHFMAGLGHSLMEEAADRRYGPTDPRLLSLVSDWIAAQLAPSRPTERTAAE